MPKTDKKKESIPKSIAAKSRKYYFAVGRRKEAVARVRLYRNGKGEVVVNGKMLEEFFPAKLAQENILSPLKAIGLDGKTDLSVKVLGGGPRGQADSIRLGIARALLLVDENFRTTLKPKGMLKRDPRVKERKKYGLKKARRAPQWKKR